MKTTHKKGKLILITTLLLLLLLAPLVFTGESVFIIGDSGAYEIATIDDDVISATTVKSLEEFYPLKVNWLGSAVIERWDGFHFTSAYLPYEIGLREDGIVVWRKMEKKE